MLILSWGCGLQSTLLLEMSSQGQLPKIDAAIFSDTGFEHEYSYEVYDFYAPRAIKAGINVIKISGQDIFGDSLKKAPPLPLFVERSGRKIKRRCTRDYKIRPIQRVVRDLLGVNRRGRLRADLVTTWLGITVDEIDRAKPSRVAFIKHEFPLLNLGMNRQDCENWFQSRGLLVPKKSSCKFCPYKSPKEWSRMKTEDKQSFVLIADLEQHINQKGLVKIGGQKKEVHFYPSGPLLEANFFGKNQPEGEMCDGGYCNS